MVTKFLNVSTDPTLSTNSNILVPSEKAVRSFIASKAIQLDFIQSVAPTTYSTGQKWLNTSDNKLYTAVSSSDWGTGVSVETDQFFTYQDLLYYFDGTSICSYSTLSVTETNADSQVKFWVGTRAQYNLVNPKDASTMYYVVEDNIDYAVLATQTQFDNSSDLVATTPYQVKQALGNYLSLVNGGNLAAGKSIGLTNTNNEVSTLSYDTNGYIVASNKFKVTNETNVGSLVVTSGNVYKTNTSGATVVWSDSYATTSKAGAVMPDGTSITINNGVISASGTAGLSNTATGTSSLTILGSPNTYSYSVNIGESSFSNTYAVSLGNMSEAQSESTAIGAKAEASGSKSIAIGSSSNNSDSTRAINQNSIAIGYNAKSSGNYAIQLGYGTNSNANTLSIGLDSNNNYQLLDSTGTIPNARIPAATSAALGGVILVYDSTTNTLDIRTTPVSS